MSVRPSQIAAGLVLAAAAVGFVVGTRGNRVSTDQRQAILYARSVERPERVSLTGATPAASWAELAETRRGPNAHTGAHLHQVVGTAPLPETAEGRPERLAAARVHRARLRAYDGAPPRIPHAIDQRSTTACLACHAEGLVIADRVAPRMSHPVYQNCTQCHVRDGEQGAPEAPFPADFGLGRDAPPVNTFAGLSTRPGVRFLPDAPPVMPHSRTNREDCVSCHGPLGTPGLRTTHPERQNCEQCHAPGPSPIQEIFFR